MEPGASDPDEWHLLDAGAAVNGWQQHCWRAGWVKPGEQLQADLNFEMVVLAGRTLTDAGAASAQWQEGCWPGECKVVLV